MKKGLHPEQAVLSRDTDMSKTEKTRHVIEGMVDGLNDHRIDDIGDFFSESFRWMGNQGCGTKNGLRCLPGVQGRTKHSLGLPTVGSRFCSPG